ncbi:hypothetical protein [Aestuariispira ectoiniformans]|uniref:hypothetical protein n=1 Tax=Aestuariispira ectoiniformans TaxID=2775080 RepID=UPI00223C11F0|nr:hypothetical protein [Aestuariispira ectoiniformans]
MPTPEQKHLNAAEQLKSVKELWSHAPAGEKKEKAQQYFTAAEEAHRKNMDNKCIEELAKVRDTLK